MAIGLVGSKVRKNGPGEKNGGHKVGRHGLASA
jgi:hypothetical protein